MSAPGVRAALLAGGAAVVLVAGATFANAQSAGNVTFEDPSTALQQSQQQQLDVAVRPADAPRFAPAETDSPDSGGEPHRLELKLSAGSDITGAPVDISIAQRASFGSDGNGDLNHSGSGSEVRVGRGLVQQHDGPRRGTSVYAFVSSDDQALTWRPGSRDEFGGSGSSFSLQDQVQVGDRSAGIAYEVNGIQASLAYVEREESTRVGNQSYSQDQNFTGITLTMRH